MIQCNGSSPVIVAETKCTIEETQFKASPFSLPWGSHIFAKVKALNVVGSSDYSQVGNGGQILTTPSAPTKPTEPLVTTSTEITITWL
jgi:hypothetical protein